MRTDLIQIFRDKLARGPVVGPFCKTEDPAIIETLGYAGMDFAILDLEHGPADNAGLGGLIRAAELSGALPVVRVNGVAGISRSLDQGALAVQIPHVASAATAEAVIRQARFAPLGDRGVCRYVRAAAYGTQDRFEYFREANNALVILQVEGREGLDNLDAILDVPGFDILFLGVYDLSQSLGLIGEVDHPKVRESLETVARKCRMRGCAAGTFVETIEQARTMAGLGFHYLCYGVDVGILATAASGIVRGVRGDNPLPATRH